MRYTVKEIYYTLQGEGAHTGRAAVFCRFAGCNLWSGHEADRPAAVCPFCDTDFAGTDGPQGGRFESAVRLAGAVARVWDERLLDEPDRRPPAVSTAHSALHIPETPTHRFVVCTGGEPLLQLDGALIDALKSQRFEIAIETNGTLPAPPGIDWICVSPKAGAPLEQTTGDELKLVYPQPHAEPGRFESLDFRHFFLQPMDGSELAGNTQLAVRYCLANPQWRLSLQMHKLAGLR